MNLDISNKQNKRGLHVFRFSPIHKIHQGHQKPEKDDDDVDGGDGDGVKCEEENKWEGIVHEGEKVTCVTTSPTGADTIQKKNIKWHKIKSDDNVK